MQYLTYDEYESIGGKCDLAAFNKTIIRACGIIDNATHGRISEMLVIPDDVKHCLREIIDYLDANVSTENVLTSKSQSVGGVSESESYSIKGHDDISADLDQILFDYLLHLEDGNGNSLLYRGRGA